ncbi:MAG: HU family DNA-binding protein [Candidatus Kapabacteria bacterium]|nr:HU family DNA-binding protein [Candidatus Kapabacteria bacterium]
MEVTMSLNKTQLVDAIAKKTEMKKTDVEKNLKATLEVIADELANGGSVSLIGFGTFSVSERQERQGINPRDKSAITIPAKRIAKFKPGSALSEKVDYAK